MRIFGLHYTSWILIVVLLFEGCHSKQQKQPSDQAVTKKSSVNFSIIGAYALYPLAQIWVDEYRQLHPEFRISAFPASSTKGVTDALLGLTEIGLYSGLHPESIDEALIVFKVAKDAVVPTISRSNPYLTELTENGLSIANLRDVYITGRIDSWNHLTGAEEGRKIVLFTRSDASGAAAVWAEFLGATQENLKGIGVYGDAGMAQAVRSNIYSLGYDNLRFVFDNKSGRLYPGLYVPPVDFNKNDRIDPEERLYANIESLKEGIKSGDYPYPLARDLYLVVNREQKNPYVRDFLKWVLTEGTLLTNGAGYVGLTEDESQREFNKLMKWLNEVTQSEEYSESK